jgi:FkbM family methyltransferase
LRLKRAIKALLGRAVWISPQISIETERHGSPYGGWNIVKRSLNAESVVLSFGLGEDISFDTSLIATYGCSVHGFDPTPRAIAHVKALKVPRFVLHEFGVSNRDGTLQLFVPENPAFVSASELVVKGRTSVRSFEAPVKRLSTIVRELALERIDLLKMDVEGSEYSIIEDSEEHESLQRTTQLLVEFHHMWKEVGAVRTYRAISTLSSLGFELAWISDSSNEFLFIREPALDPPGTGGPP